MRDLWFLEHVKHFVPMGLWPEPWVAEKCICGSRIDEKNQCLALMEEKKEHASA